MKQDIQDMIKERAEYRNVLPDKTVVLSTVTNMDIVLWGRCDFIEGANFVLSHPELLREQMEDLITWISDNEFGYADLLNPQKVTNSYIENLNNNKSKTL